MTTLTSAGKERMTSSLNVRFGSSVRHELALLAFQRGSTPSQLVREAVLRMLVDSRKRGEGDR